MQGNKGGVSVRLSIFGHMVCFLNCHLPAHLEKAEQRKEDFATILHMQQFEGPMANGILDHECVPHHFASPVWSLVLVSVLGHLHVGSGVCPLHLSTAWRSGLDCRAGPAWTQPERSWSHHIQGWYAGKLLLY